MNYSIIFAEISFSPETSIFPGNAVVHEYDVVLFPLEKIIFSIIKILKNGKNIWSICLIKIFD